MIISTTLPIATSRGDATLSLDTESGEVVVEMPVSFRTPRVALTDLETAVRELREADAGPHTLSPR